MIAKRLWLQVHRWCGLAAALFVLVQALTGSMLVFRGEVARILDPQGMVRRSAGVEAPLSRSLAVLQRAYPGFEVQRIVYPQTPDATYVAHMVNAQGVARYASVDPGTGEILRSGSVWRFPAEAALLIHDQLMGGKPGLAFMLVLGIWIAGMAVTGASYWWPKAGRWRKALEITWRAPGRLLLRQLHRTVGLCVALVALVSVGTGLLVGGELLLGSGPISSVHPSGVSALAAPDVDRGLAVAQAFYPGRALRDVRMPDPTRFNVFFWAPERSALAVHAVRMDAATAKVTEVVPAEQDHGLWVTFLPIHTGEAFGLAGKLVLLASGLGLAALAVTGPIMWLQRRAPAGRKR